MGTMKLVLAGENTQLRAAREVAVLRGRQEQGSQVERRDLAKTDPDTLLVELNTQTMFATPKVWAITGWEKLRSTKQQDLLVATLTNNTDDVLLIIGKDLTPRQKKLFPAPIWRIETFPLPKSVFAFCDGLGSKSYIQLHTLWREVLAAEGEWWLNAQLVRTLHGIWQIKAGIKPTGAPFQIAKWQKQARSLTIEEVESWLSGLFQIESSVKTGRTRLSWGQQFDILLAKIYVEGH